MSKQQAAALLEAADQWKQRCLLDGGSLFTDERLWTRDHFEQLRVHVVENADGGSDGFWERLRRLIDPAPPEAKRLWAEMTWAFYLGLSRSLLNFASGGLPVSAPRSSILRHVSNRTVGRGQRVQGADQVA